MKKPGMMKAKQNTRNKKTKETLTKSPGIVVGENNTTWETVNVPSKIISKRMQKNSVI